MTYQSFVHGYFHGWFIQTNSRSFFSSQLKCIYIYSGLKINKLRTFTQQFGVFISELFQERRAVRHFERFPHTQIKKQNDHIIVNLKFFIVAFPVDSKNTGTTSSTPSSPLWWCQIYRSWTVFATLSSFGWWLERCPLAKKIHMCYVFNWIRWGDLCLLRKI